MKALITTVLLLLTAVPAAWSTPAERALRRHVAEGNELYHARRYAEAEVAYRKALEADSTSAAATYNLAATLLKQATPGESGQQLMQDAQRLLARTMRLGDEAIASLAAYNLGNLAYNNEQWDPAIEAYKQALRLDPDFDRARDNLRMAQLKKREQEQNPDQQQQQQQQEQQQQEQQQQEQQPQQQQPQQQSGISDDNAEQILKAMENAEAQTRRRVQQNEMREKANATRRQPIKNW